MENKRKSRMLFNDAEAAVVFKFCNLHEIDFLNGREENENLTCELRIRNGTNTWVEMIPGDWIKLRDFILPEIKFAQGLEKKAMDSVFDRLDFSFISMEDVG